MKIKTKEMKALSDLLHNPDVKLRNVTYHAVGEVLVSRLIASEDLDNKNYVPNLRMKVKKLVEYVNELAICDKVMLENTFSNLLKYKLYKNSYEVLKSKLYDYSSFEDVLGISTFFSNSTIEEINSNFSLYKEALKLTLSASDKIMDDYND